MTANPTAPIKVPVAEFVTSAADPEGWPEEGPPEVAFVGRSNVGKSSLLNTLVARRGLARTSRTPGVTRLVNFFHAEVLVAAAASADGPQAEQRVELALVDLPGFGYAKVSKSERSTWRPAIERYLGGRTPLRAVALLVDARRLKDTRPGEDPIEDERALAPWIAARGIVVIPVLTKIDKLAKHERKLVADELRRDLGAGPVLFSAITGEGREQLWRRLLSAATTAAATGAGPEKNPGRP